jgi:hypothetical protein
MTLDEFEQDQLAAAARLRKEADADDQRAHELVEDNPSYSGYLERRAAWKRHMANDRDGGQ